MTTPAVTWERNWAYLGPTAIGSNPRGEIANLYNATTVAVDIETESLEDTTILGIGFSPNSQESFYFPIDSPYLPWRLLTEHSVQKIFHNGHFDIRILDDYLESGQSITNVIDSIIAATLLGLPPALNTLVRLLFQVELPTIQDLIGKKGKGQLTMSQVPEEQVALKCCNDTRYTYKIMETLAPHVPVDAFALEMEYMGLIADIERRGMVVDLDKLKSHSDRITKEVDYYRSIARGMGFNPGSSPQVAAMLQSRGWVISYNGKTGKPKLNAQMLKTVYKDDPVAQLTMLYRQANILKTTFIDAIYNKHLQPDGKIYGTINQITTASGRTSRTNPNLQNQPPALRDIFIASSGCRIEEWDLSQIELRIVAWLVAVHTGDHTMLRVFTDNTGSMSDIHSATAIFMFGTDAPHYRRIAKAINFSILYGGDENTLYQRSGIPLAQGWEFIQKYFQTYPGVKIYIDQTMQQILQYGYTATELGRRRYFPSDQLNSEYGRAKALREGFNHKIQGTAGEIQKRLQLKVRNEPQINMVHDSIEFDNPISNNLPHDASEGLAEYRTPMEVKVGPSWGDTKVIGVFG